MKTITFLKASLLAMLFVANVNVYGQATENDGSKEKPYTVADVISLNNAQKGPFYVKGYIVGQVVGSKLSDAAFSAPWGTSSATSTQNTNLVIADNADETGLNDPTIRCLTDEDIQTINQASFDPLGKDEADRMNDLLERHTGIDGADDYGVIQIRDADQIKALLDWQIFYGNTGNVGPYPDEYQMASIIDETPTSYVYTYYRNSPASAICQTSWSGPEYVIPHKIPSYSIELGDDCQNGDTYVENRGFTYINTITINKDDMTVPLKGNNRIRAEYAPELTLVHDSVHYVDFGDRWCEATEQCRDYYDNR